MNILFVTKRDQVPRIRILAWYIGHYPHPVIRMDFYNHGHFWALWVQVNWILHDSHLFTYPLTNLLVTRYTFILKKFDYAKMGSRRCTSEIDPRPRNILLIEKSTIFTQFLWHFAKMARPWVGHFDKVS